MVAARTPQDDFRGGFTALYRRWRDVVRLEALSVTESEADADDVVQLVFLRLWDSGRWQDIRQAASYFRGAARREALRVRARAKRRSDMPELVDPSMGPLQRASKGEVNQAIREAIAALPPQCRSVMTLTVIGGLTAQEVAEECGSNTKAVRKQRTRGWRLLRSWFDAHGGADVWLSTIEDGGGVGLLAALLNRGG